MVLEVEPTAEDIETAVLRPSRRICEPTRQLFGSWVIVAETSEFLEVKIREPYRVPLPYAGNGPLILVADRSNFPLNGSVQLEFGDRTLQLLLAEMERPWRGRS
jgi:hypothetical protein